MPFPTAHRPLAKPTGAATNVPFHWVPPPMVARDPTTTARNAPRVPFAQSTRDAWEKTHRPVQSMPNAGPGAYEVRVEVLSTKAKTVREGAFATARRDAGALPPVQTVAGPEAPPKLDFVRTTQPKVAFARAPRDVVPHNAGFPGPRPVNFTALERRGPALSFTTAPREGPAANPATADVPLHQGTRPAKHKPAFKFSTAPRW